MSLEQIWAPWRLGYILENKDKKEAGQGACFLCEAVPAGDDKGRLVVQRTERSIVVLNRYPYNNGHLLVAPKAHKAALDELDDAELLDVQYAVRGMVERLTKRMHPEGFNIGLNLGKPAGAGLPGHLHWHVVPRWIGDTNFMPVVAGVHVIPQSLEALFELLTQSS